MLERERPQHINTLSMPGIRKFPLTVDQIKAWVDAYRARMGGEFPSVKSGPILNADGSNTGETWCRVDTALRRGLRGLRNSGFKSLSDFLDKTYSDERQITARRIKAWVDAHRARHGGFFPTQLSGPILNPDGSQTGRTWGRVDSALREGLRGLKDSGFTSLPNFLDKSYPDERNGDLTIARIKEWVEAYRARYELKFPSSDSGPILNPDGFETGETWGGVQQAFTTGGRGLKDSGLTSLADFLDKIYPAERRNRDDLTPARIKEWVVIYRARHGGKFPSENSGPIFDEDGHKTGTTWGSVNAAFRAGFRGLKDSGFRSLADFLNKTYPAVRGTVEPVKKEKPDDITSLLNLI